VGDAPIDIIVKGYDAGIGPKERAAADLIAMRVMGPMKIALVGAPAYFALRRPPRLPPWRCSISAGRGRWHACVAVGTERQDAADHNERRRGPLVRQSMGSASHSRRKPSPSRSCARGNWSGCWRTGRRRSRDFSSVILGIGRSRPACTPSSTHSVAAHSSAPARSSLKSPLPEVERSEGAPRIARLGYHVHALVSDDHELHDVADQAGEVTSSSSRTRPASIHAPPEPTCSTRKSITTRVRGARCRREG
jgi:hypothetical protein